MQMPEPDAAILARKAEIVRRLQAVLRARRGDPRPRTSCAPTSATPSPPTAARRSRWCCPSSTAEVAAVLRVCHDERVPVVPRGAGTSLAGGALPTADCVLLGVARLTEVLEVDFENRFIRVQTGRTNLSVTGRGRGRGLLLRARPVEPARLRHRRQHRDELGRRALPEVRGDHQQPARGDDGADGRHGRRARRRASRRARPRPARRRLRLRGPARRGDRGDAAHPAQARGGAPGADGLRLERGRPAPASATSSAPACCRWRSSSWTAPASAPARPSPMPATRTSRRC